jgi:predicted aspartyl protease
LLLLSAALAAAATPLATISISVARNRIMVPVTLNGSNGLSFMLDTGFSMTMVNPALPEALQLRRAGEITIEGIAGDEQAATYEGATFGIGGLKYQPRRVATLASDTNRRRRRDGILGSGVFRQFVVELDSQRQQLSLYAPTNFIYQGRGEVLPLRFSSTTPVIKATIQTTNGTAVQAEFEIDTGCDSGLCLGHEFIKTHQLLDLADTRESGKFGVGGGTETRSGHLPQLQMGRLKLDRPQTDFFLEGSPVGRKLAGHIGMGVLKHFKVIFDYSRKQMILEPVLP